MSQSLSEIIANIGDGKIEKERIVQALSFAVRDWLDYRTEELFSKLYRLDVRESDIKLALGSENIAHALATLIYNRQEEKIISRKNNPPNRAPEDLKW